MATTSVRTTCNRDCPDTCGIVADVTDGRVVRLRGDKAHPVTRGFLCQRTNGFLHRQYHPDRLTRPLLKRDGRFEPINADAALDLAAERLTAIRDADGPAAICHFDGGGSLGLLRGVVQRFFEHFGPVSVKRGDICSGAGEFAQLLDFGVSDSNDLLDLHHARHVLNWGKNLHCSNVHLLPVVAEARRRGAGYVVIDPAHTPSAAEADAHVQLRPGGDIALAQAVGRVLFASDRIHPDAERRCVNLEAFRTLCQSRPLEALCFEADVTLAQVRDLADRLCDGPTAILVGWGLQRRLRGASTVRMLDALAAVTGNLGVSGGGVSFYYARRSAFAADVSGTRPPARTFPEPQLAEFLTTASDPPVRALWVNHCNPVAMLPDSAAVAHAIADTEFVVVAEQFLTDTAQRADLVLPVTTLLEDDDLLGAYGHHWLGVSRPVVPPPGDARTDLQWIQGLAERVGLADAVAGTAAEWKTRFLAPVADAGVTLDALDAGPVRNPRAASVIHPPDAPLPTPTGRVNLISALPDRTTEEADVREGEFPLWLCSNSTRRAQSSQWLDGPDGAPGDVVAVVHPHAAPGLADGAPARLISALGQLDVVVRLDPAQRPDVVIVPKGGHLDRGHAANALIAARVTDFGEGAAYQDTRVRLAGR